ncbi:MAG: DNA replication/repair protein RecF, partial [Candidatus Nanopelagicales bacterium]
MYVAALELADFRSYEHAALTLEPGVSVLVGANGQGKTNVVEAIAYLSSLSSHRVASDVPLIRHGTERAVVRGLVVRDDRQLLLEVELIAGKANRARVNKSALPRVRDVLGILRTVLFAPEDLTLVRGDPEQRRRFLDELLVARAPRFAGVRSDYERVLKQRNALLKSAAAARGSFDESTLHVWNEHLVSLASELLAGRLALIEDLRPYVRDAYASLANVGGPAILSYKASWVRGSDASADPTDDSQPLKQDAIADALALALVDARREELARGLSLVGPHRDDLVLHLGELPAKGYASHGESWSFALALRLASFGLLRDDGDDPVLILDDVFAELDETRRSRLADMVAPAEQVIVTA